MFPGFHDLCLSERNRVIRTGMRRTIVRLAIEFLVFEEQNRVLRPDRCPEKAACVECIRREYHAQAGNVCERYFAALAMVNRPPCQVPPDWNPHDHGAREAIV